MTSLGAAAVGVEIGQPGLPGLISEIGLAGCNFTLYFRGGVALSGVGEQPLSTNLAAER